MLAPHSRRAMPPGHDAADIAHDGLSLDQDAATGLFRIAGAGFWTLSQVDAHFERLSIAILAQRRRSRTVRALIDLTASPVQSPQVADRVRLATGAIYRAGDRVSVLVASPLARAQMARVLDGDICQVFTERQGAESWLNG